MRNGIKDGIGTAEYSNGDIYDGTWVGNERSGEGK